MIPESQYSTWNQEYNEACAALINREERMDELQEKIEINLELVAATAIEDKLQDDVAITINSLKDAGIKFWVLTGDKIETAINIGYSCGLLSDKLEKIIIDGKESAEVEYMIDTKLNYLKKKERLEEIALVISGDALIHASKGNSAQKVRNFIYIIFNVIS